MLGNDAHIKPPRKEWIRSYYRGVQHLYSVVKSHLRRGKWVHDLRRMPSGQERASESFEIFGFYTECNWKSLKG